MDKGIICKNFIGDTPQNILREWMDQLYSQRVEYKCNFVQDYLNQTRGDWEAVTFIMLAKAFGLKVNGELFMQVASSFPFKIMMKEQHEVQQIEALLFGQSRLFKRRYQR